VNTGKVHGAWIAGFSTAALATVFVLVVRSTGSLAIA
jgi:hypothetical protein